MAVSDPNGPGVSSQSPTPGAGADPWPNLIPEADRIEWCRARRPPFPAGVVLVTAALVDTAVAAAVAIVVAPTHFLAGALRGWPAFLLGPVLGGLLWPAIVPYRIGVGPRGLLLRFPLRTVFVPWGLVTALPTDEPGVFPLGYVDPTSMRSFSYPLDAYEVAWILAHVDVRAWPGRAHLTRGWPGEHPIR
ncbi:MAG TPA: hypothetical protein VMC82_03990 [Thermoplasmata archaeon]|nr:hypothetical protein [Thermoplasmata archaeon]